MAHHNSIRAAVSTAVLASLLCGCSGGSRVATASGYGGQTNGDIGVATKAMIALNRNDLASATTFAERAVEKTPGDAGFRTLLGNIYFAGGRFASAEAAYKDALALYDNQPQAILKLALAEIAQGKSVQAIAHLNAGRLVIDPADYGLALALAGQVGEGLDALQFAARANNADARVRQNLALVTALAGDWTQARVLASQDLPGDQVDLRMQQWAKLAKPDRASDQVATLLGINPAAVDLGQPVRLALRQAGSSLAEAAPAPPQPQAAAEMRAMPVEVAQALPPPPALPPVDPVRIAATVPAPETTPYYQPALIAAPAFAPAPAPAPAPAFAPDPAVAEADYLEPSRFAAAIAKAKARKARAAVIAAASPAKRPALLKVALRHGKANAVVQLGAYSSPDRVQVAWDKAARKYAALRNYAPMGARFTGAKGNFYRLSVHGFASASEAGTLCASIKRSGGSCFVRSSAGDSPMRIASR